MKNRLLLASALLPLCAGIAPLAAAAESQPEPAPTTSIEAPAPKDDAPRTDLHNESVNPWLSYEVVDDNHVRVFVALGTDSCYGVRAEVQETKDSIAIATISGTLPEAPTTCTRELRGATLLIATEQPVGDRAVTHLSHPHLHAD